MNLLASTCVAFIFFSDKREIYAHTCGYSHSRGCPYSTLVKAGPLRGVALAGTTVCFASSGHVSENIVTASSKNNHLSSFQWPYGSCDAFGGKVVDDDILPSCVLCYCGELWRKNRCLCAVRPLHLNATRKHTHTHARTQEFTKPVCVLSISLGPSPKIGTLHQTLCDSQVFQHTSRYKKLNCISFK